jgi:hypothetical protein
MKDLELARDWEGLGNYPIVTVREKIRSAMVRRGIHPNRSELEELTQEGIGFCWQYFRELRPKAENAKQAVLTAAKQAARAVARGERFVSDPSRQRSVLTIACAELDSIPVETSAQRTNDYRKAERIISALPDHLRGVARQLAYGDTVEAIAHKQGRHRKTIERSVRDMRAFISLTYWRLCDALLSALH